MRSMWERLFLAAWQKRGVLACLLWPLSKLFQWIVNFRFALFVLGYKKQTRIAVPVIIVGNIFIGGTGKTPLVIWLVKELQKAGRHPAVISRGYGATAENVVILDGNATAQQVGDEPLLIAERTGCPVAVGRDRVAVAQCLLAALPEIDIILADDGLQHYALARDIEIVLFDQRGIGNGWMLPAGPLRESVQRRRDFTVCNLAAGLEHGNLPGMPPDTLPMYLQGGAAYSLHDSLHQKDLKDFQGQRLVAAAGIGNPQRFFTMLEQHGLQSKTMPFPDHYAFDAKSFAGIDAECILITEKDAVKCRQIAALKNDARIWVVPVEAQLDAGFAATLIQMISEKTHGSTPA